MSDLKKYVDAMIFGDADTCTRIEKKYDLYGYPPEVVTVGLKAAENGLDPLQAVDDYLAA